MAGDKLLTVVTVVRNGAASIHATLESVRRVKAPGIEYVVIDGNSSDGTQSAIEAYADVVDVYVSEPDRGIYDAMNKAAARASGRYLLHINAGDTLLRAPLMELSSLADDVAVAAFPVTLSGGGQFVPRVDRLLCIANTIHHQGACYSRSALRPYDLTFRTFADFDLNQHLRQAAVTFAGAAPIAHHTENGQSQDRGNFHEVYAIVRKNSGAPAVLLTWVYFKLRGLRGRIASLRRSSS